jgi:hypothetical protein
MMRDYALKSDFVSAVASKVSGSEVDSLICERFGSFYEEFKIFGSRQVEDLRQEVKSRMQGLASKQTVEEVFRELELKVDRGEFEQ